VSVLQAINIALLTERGRFAVGSAGYKYRLLTECGRFGVGSAGYKYGLLTERGRFAVGSAGYKYCTPNGARKIRCGFCGL